MKSIISIQSAMSWEDSGERKDFHVSLEPRSNFSFLSESGKKDELNKELHPSFHHIKLFAVVLRHDVPKEEKISSKWLPKKLKLIASPIDVKFELRLPVRICRRHHSTALVENRLKFKFRCLFPHLEACVYVDAFLLTKSCWIMWDDKFGVFDVRFLQQIEGLA